MANTYSNSITHYTAKGLREDLQDMIYDISPTETPFLTNAARMKATSTLHEWQIDSLATAAANAQITGDDSTAAAVAPTIRIKNVCQILSKSYGVPGTLDAISKAGRKSEMNYLRMKAGKELKRDLEFALTQNSAATVGTTANARKMAGLESWLTNYSSSATAAGTGQTTPGYDSTLFYPSSGPTDSSNTGILTVNALKTVIRTAWTNGGDPSFIMCGPYNKTVISQFAGIATQFRDVKNRGVIITGADLFISDFGEHTVVPNRFSRDRTVFVLDMEYLGVAYLRPMQTHELGKMGDGTRELMVAEATLVVKNPSAHGKVTDNNTT